jgi:hypothetical protein
MKRSPTELKANPRTKEIWAEVAGPPSPDDPDKPIPAIRVRTCPLSFHIMHRFVEKMMLPKLFIAIAQGSPI